MPIALEAVERQLNELNGVISVVYDRYGNSVFVVCDGCQPPNTPWTGKPVMFIQEITEESIASAVKAI